MVNHFYYFLYKKSFDSCDPHLKKRNFIMFYCWWEHLPKLINPQWIKAAVKVSPFPVKISQIKKSGKWSWLDMIAPAIPSVWCGVVWACVNAFNQNTKIAGSGFSFGLFFTGFLKLLTTWKHNLLKLIPTNWAVWRLPHDLLGRHARFCIACKKVVPVWSKTVPVG